MKTIKKDELYRSLGGFLKSKGIELKDGVYPHRVSRACDLLTDAINDTRKTMKRAQVKVNEKLDQLRQSIHEATAPKHEATAPKPPPVPPAPQKPAGKSGTKSARPKARSSSARRK